MQGQLRVRFCYRTAFTEDTPMKWRNIFGNLLISAAACVLLIEAGEFAVLAYVWSFATAEKTASVFENSVIMGTTLLTLFGSLLLTVSALTSVSRRFAWPTVRVFSALVGFVALTQLLFLLMAMVNFEGNWLNEFFRTKSPTFAAGMVSALVLTITYNLVRPWRSRPQGSGAPKR